MQRARNQETTEGIQKLVGELADLGWYHTIELPDGKIIQGIQTLEQMRKRLAQYPIPQDLRGKRVLDIGAWDGWYSFEMEKRGASVVAIDSARQETFFQAKKLLNSKVEYHVADICRVGPRELGYFDIVLFFGVLYHVKHPLLAIENVCEMTTDLACIETAVTDDPAQPGAIPAMEFYEGTEFAGQFDNWVGPNTSCLLAFCRTAGFVNVELRSVLDFRAHAIGYRKWPNVARSGAGPGMICVENTWTRDHNFASGRDDYFTAWFTSSESNLDCSNVFLEVGSFACQPVGVQKVGETGWQANAKLPLGLSAGWHDVRVAVNKSEWSNPLRIPLDLSRSERRSSRSPVSDKLEIAGVTDGKTFEPNRVQNGVNSCVSVWAGGLPEDVTQAALSLRLDGTDLPSTYVSVPDAQGLRQINAMLPPKLEPGEYLIAVNLQGVESRPVPIQLYA